jgi:chromosome segregation ATPase
MRLKSIELQGFKSFAKKTPLEFSSSITAIVGPNGSGKSNIAESFRFVLGEQSMKSMRGRKGEDLIWNGSSSVPRGNRASVKLVFDNADRAFSLDFDEVAIERVVHRDGTNDYLLNGSQVRLRDVAELLSGANIGASGHHIISQGEADRVLSASSRERREMIEDALGLTAFLYKREEAERKLGKTAENIKEVEALRRELVPHLKFLGSQVKKIEESQALRETLAEQYAEYLKRETIYLKLAEALLRDEKDAPARELKNLNEKIEHLKRTLDKKGKTNLETHQLIDLEARGRALRQEKDEITRELGRIEGELLAREHMAKEASGTIPARDAHLFAQTIETELSSLLSLEGASLHERLLALIKRAREFAEGLTAKLSGNTDSSSVEDLKKRKSELEQRLVATQKEEEKTAQAVHKLHSDIENEKDANREAERELFQAMAERSGVESMLAGLRARENILAQNLENYKIELREAAVLLLRDAQRFEEYVVRDEAGDALSDAEIFEEERSKQEERRRKLERMKIRLEEIGAGNSEEILKEHKETTERDQFLMRELEDLHASTEKLRQLIEELTETLEERFENGIEKINKEFDSFFKLMFGGGSASLALIKEKKLKRAAPSLLGDEEVGTNESEEDDDEEDVEIEEGIDISVVLPHKRVKGLHMLSGGERALTSIALIFAMSQVNPPPFLILDETDAALDEANSRRYGDMIENLSRKSQLILITHNRETMSRAGILYGITVGQDAVSKLLSVRFEEALAVAK